MKAYVVAAGAAVILFSALALVLLVAIKSDGERPLQVGGTADAGGSPEAGSQGRGAGDRAPPDPGPSPMDLDPDVEAEVEALLRGDDSGSDPQDDRPPSPLSAGDCELVISISDPAGEPVPRIVATLLAGLSRSRAETDEGGMCVFGYYSRLPYLVEMTGLTQYSLAKAPLMARGAQA